MEKTIYLTERDIHKMIKESLQTLLLEALTPDEIYNNYYSTIDRDIFNSAIAADPTSYNPQGKINKVGSYVKWILKLYKNGSWKPGDSVETKDLLSKFNKLKSKLPVEQRDINTYSSVRELYNVLQPYLGIKTRSEIKSDAEKVYEDNDWLIIIPHTKEAACSYGANTKWCTAAENSENMFNYYNNEGPLYINIHKPTNKKYQFHFESGQFMDEEDNEIQPNDLPWTEGAKNYYKSINKYAYFIFDFVANLDDNGIARVKLNSKWNFFSSEKQEVLFPNQWFDFVDDFFNGIATVELNGKWTWLSLEKQDYLFPNKWFDFVDDFYNGIARVKLNGKETWFSLKKQGLLFPNQWFNLVSYFDDNGIATVQLNGKWNWFSLEKQDYLFPNKWFDFVDDFYSNGIAKVKLNGKKYYFTLDGQFLNYYTKQPLSDEELQSLHKQQQIAEMTNRLVRNYLR